MGRPKRACTAARLNVNSVIMTLPDDVLIECIKRLRSEDKLSLRLVCSRLRQVTSLTIHRITLNDLQYSELTGPDRRSALCLKLSSRFPAITSCTFTRIYDGPVSLIPKLIKQLPHLTELDCYNVRPAPAVAQQLSTCRHLTHLQIDVTSNRSLSALPALPNLQSLRLHLQFESLSSTSLTSLTQYSRIHTLTIDTTGCSYPETAFKADLSSLSQLPTLTSLAINWLTGFMDTSISQLTTLTSLQLHGMGISTSTANSVLHLTNLRELSIVTHCTNPQSSSTAWTAIDSCNLTSRSRPTFPHLTNLTVPARLLAGTICPRTPALAQLQIAVGRADAEPAALDALIPALQLSSVTHFRANIDGFNNNRPATLKLLKQLTTECPTLQRLNLCGPFPAEAVDSVACLKELREFTLDTRVMTHSDRDELKARLEGLRLELPSLASLNYSVQLVPPYVLFWNVLQFL